MTNDPRPDDPGPAQDGPRRLAADGTSEPIEEPAREWWEEPGLPWKHKPTRSDIACLCWIGFVSVYSLVMLPLRPVMLTLSPYVLGSLGYRSGLVLMGALTATGDRWWPLVLLLGSLGAMKFDWIYWWAGKLWGHGLIEVWTGRASLAPTRYAESLRKLRDRRVAWAVGFAHRFESLAIFITFLPIPLPAPVIYAALGAAGTKLSKFLAVGFASSLVTTSAYLYLGYSIGEPAVKLVEQYGQWLWYFALGIIAVMLIGLWWRRRAQRKATRVEPN